MACVAEHLKFEDAAAAKWNRLVSTASTTLPADEDGRWTRAESSFSSASVDYTRSPSTFECPDAATADTQDWRPLTSSLRAALETAQRNEADMKVANSAVYVADTRNPCPSVITSETEDWRPQTATLRAALKSAQNEEAQMQAARSAFTVANTGNPCPSVITSETEDWRALASTLKTAFAKVQDDEKARKLFVPAEFRRSSNVPDDLQEACVCPSEITAQTEDWRPLTTTLRQAFKNAPVEKACVCPSEITAQTEDWRPLATTLRQALQNAPAEMQQFAIDTKTSDSSAGNFVIVIACLTLVVCCAFIAAELPAEVSCVILSLCFSSLTASVLQAPLVALLLIAVHLFGITMFVLNVASSAPLM